LFLQLKPFVYLNPAGDNSPSQQKPRLAAGFSQLGDEVRSIAALVLAALLTLLVLLIRPALLLLAWLRLRAALLLAGFLLTGVTLVLLALVRRLLVARHGSLLGWLPARVISTCEPWDRSQEP
jgi:hypothetical protein